MATKDINLLQKNGGSVRFISIERILTRLMWISLGIVCIAGVSIGSVYIVVSSQQSREDARKAALIGSIKEMATKEGILVSLQQRIAVASKALDAARPYGNLFGLLDHIAPSEYFTSLSIDDVGRSTVTLVIPSVDEAVTTVANVIIQFDEKKIRSPQLLSFALKESGIVQLSLSFIANL